MPGGAREENHGRGWVETSRCCTLRAFRKGGVCVFLCVCMQTYRHLPFEERHDGGRERQDQPSDPVVEQEGVLGGGVVLEREAPEVGVARLSRFEALSYPIVFVCNRGRKSQKVRARVKKEAERPRPGGFVSASFSFAT